MKLSFIVPCYNEVENVPKLHAELLPVVEASVAQGWPSTPRATLSAELIFVDDGSRDGTFTRLKEYFDIPMASDVALKFIKHETNLGLGAALRTGFAAAKGDVIVTLDSDGTYEFSGIPALLSLLTSNIDIVTASPYHPRGGVIGVPPSRLILSRGSSLLYRVLVDWRVYTYTCLFRAYRSEVIHSIAFGSDGFLAGTEILVKAMMKGYRVAEFPAILRKRTYGSSKAKIMQTVVSHLRFQAWVAFHRVQSLVGMAPEPQPRGHL